MNALILGGTKFMGKHLVQKLISDGHNVTIATRGNQVDPFGDKVKRIIVDRQKAKDLTDAFKDKHYDVTIDNLAYCSNDIKILLDSLSTDKYVMTSTASVYAGKFHENMKESEMDTRQIELKWCNIDDFGYDEIKRQAEAALFQAYPAQKSAAVRFPYIFGKDDWTKRLFFYIESIFMGRAMNIDNISARLSFIESIEAGRFLAHVATTDVFGVLNADCIGTISLEEIIAYAEKLMGKNAIISADGENALINGMPTFGMDTTLAQESGFEFQRVEDWVYPLVEFWVSELEAGR